MYAVLVDRHKRMVYTLALKMMKVAEDAEEVAQDAFVKAFHSLKDFRQQCKFSTWLYKITYHICISRLRIIRKNQISIDDEQFGKFDIMETENFFDTLAAREQRRIIKASIDKLNSEDGSLITLFYLHECSVKEISLITGLSESNVKVKLYRARKQLWEYLQEMKDLMVEEYAKR